MGWTRRRGRASLLAVMVTKVLLLKILLGFGFGLLILALL